MLRKAESKEKDMVLGFWERYQSFCRQVHIVDSHFPKLSPLMQEARKEILSDSDVPAFLACCLHFKLLAKEDNDLVEELPTICEALFQVRDRVQFEMYYRRKLFDRLTSGSCRRDIERDILSSLKACISEGTMKPSESIFTEWMTSTDESNSAEYRPLRKLGLKVITFSASCVPSTRLDRGKEVSVRKLPTLSVMGPEVEHMRRSYSEVYARKHRGTKLTWLAHRGQMEFTYFPKPGVGAKACSLVAPPLVYSILYLLHQNTQMSQQDILKGLHPSCGRIAKQYLKYLSTRTSKAETLLVASRNPHDEVKSVRVSYMFCAHASAFAVS